MDKEVEEEAVKEIPRPITYMQRMRNAIVRLPKDHGYVLKCCCCDETFENQEHVLGDHLKSELHIERIQPYADVDLYLDEATCKTYFRRYIAISLPNVPKDTSKRWTRSFCYRCCDLLTDGPGGVNQHLASSGHDQMPIKWKNSCGICRVDVDKPKSHERRAFHIAVVEDNKAYGSKKDAFEVDKEPQEDPLVFATCKAYVDFWTPMLEVEEGVQRKFLKSCEMSQVQVRWEGQVGQEQRPRAYFVPRHSDDRPKKYRLREYYESRHSDALPFRLKLGDELEIGLAEPKTWFGRGRVVQVPNFVTNEACVKLYHGRGVMKYVTKGYSATPVWSDVNYRKMESTLESFVKLGETDGWPNYIVDVLLNRVKADKHYREPRIQFQWTTDKIVSLPSVETERATESVATLLGGKQPTPAQLNAVSMGMREQVCLIEGPPGTGKTTAAVLLVYNMLKQKEALKIMVCAQSNPAVDLLAVELSKAGVRVVRLYSARHVGCADDSPARRLGFVRQLLERQPELREGYDRFVDKRMQGEERAAYEKELGAAKEELWAEAQVTCCTCVSASSPELRRRRYDVLLIDEASRAIEPECLVPVVASRASRLILVGDDKQLRPVVKSLNKRNTSGDPSPDRVDDEEQLEPVVKSLNKRDTCVDSSPDRVDDDDEQREPVVESPTKLDISLFERLLQQPNLPRITLDVQQRMHPLLAQFPFGKFYRGSFANGVEESERRMSFPWLDGDRPIVFIDVQRSEEDELYGKSFSNKQEAERVIKLVGEVIESGVVEPRDIGVITPYEGQRRLLRDMIRRMIKKKETNKLGWRIARTEISNVDAFYGRQKDLIVVSFVRSGHHGRNGIGFLDDERRLNTLLTRARYKLVLIGSRSTLFSGSYVYAELIEFVNQKGLTIHLNEEADQAADISR